MLSILLGLQLEGNILTLIFFEELPNLFPISYSIFHSSQQSMKVILEGGKWGVIVVLICVSLMTNDAE